MGVTAASGATSTTALMAAASFPQAVAAGAIGGAAGSIVSQGVGVATGIQSKFDWGAVGLAAIGGGVGAGLGVAIPGTGFGPTVLRGALGNAITQGIGVATGLQSKFDWASVAAAGVMAGVGNLVGGQIGVGAAGNTAMQNDILGGVAGMAGMIAGAATRSLISGTDFGDNILAMLPDVIGQTIGNAVADGIEQAQQQDKLNAMFNDATSDPSVQAYVKSPAAQTYLQQAGYDPSQPLTPQGLVALLSANTQGLSAQDTISTIKGNIASFISQAQQYAAATGNGDAIGQALAANSALIATYSAIGLTMPNFQWTYVGAFVAYQVRQQLLSIYDYSRAGDFVSSVLPGGSIMGMTGDALANHLINTIIGGQIGVVEDIGSLALAYNAVGAGILSTFSDRNEPGYQGFKLQIAADAGSISAGRDAAIQFGIREQTYLQGMWNDPILNAAAKGMQALGLMDTTIHTPIGDIVALAGANDVTNLQDRIAIAQNAFGYMYRNLYVGNSGANWGKVFSTLTTRMNPASLPQRPTIFGI